MVGMTSVPLISSSYLSFLLYDINNDIGSDEESAEIKIESYLTYDEIQLSALLSTSCETFFINDGKRVNNGVKSTMNGYPLEGFIMGILLDNQLSFTLSAS